MEQAEWRLTPLLAFKFGIILLPVLFDAGRTRAMVETRDAVLAEVQNLARQQLNVAAFEFRPVCKSVPHQLANLCHHEGLRRVSVSTPAEGAEAHVTRRAFYLLAFLVSLSNAAL
jgi:hypothetical protein